MAEVPTKATTGTYATVIGKVAFGTATFTGVTAAQVTITPPTGAGAAICGMIRDRTTLNAAEPRFTFVPSTGVFDVAGVTANDVMDWVVFYAS